MKLVKTLLPLSTYMGSYLLLRPSTQLLQVSTVHDGTDSRRRHDEEHEGCQFRGDIDHHANSDDDGRQ